MNERDKQHASQLAAEIAGLERREDYGGRYHEACLDLGGILVAWDGPRRYYRTRMGQLTPNFAHAIATY